MISVAQRLASGSWPTPPLASRTWPTCPASRSSTARRRAQPLSRFGGGARRPGRPVDQARGSGAATLFRQQARNLEFVLAAAIEDGSDAIVTSGRRWWPLPSRPRRGARLGLEVHLVLTGPPTDTSPNVALIELFGGTCVDPDRRPGRARGARRGRLRSDPRAKPARHGRAGGRLRAIGAWGQVLAGLELADRAAAAESPRTPSSCRPRRGTGRRAWSSAARSRARRRGWSGCWPHDPKSSCARSSKGSWASSHVAGIAAPIQRVEMNGSQLGACRPPHGVEEATRLLARTEGLLVDPVPPPRAWRA